jgi:hypothetical protein
MGSLSRTALEPDELRLGVEEDAFDDEDAVLELDEDELDYDPDEDPDTGPPASGGGP